MTHEWGEDPPTSVQGAWVERGGDKGKHLESVVFWMMFDPRLFKILYRIDYGRS